MASSGVGTPITWISQPGTLSLKSEAPPGDVHSVNRLSTWTSLNHFHEKLLRFDFINHQWASIVSATSLFTSFNASASCSSVISGSK